MPTHISWPRPCAGLLAIFAALASSPSFAMPWATQIATPPQNFLQAFAAAAEERIHHSVRYEPAYVRIPYPGGDVPAATGVCTDEVIRAYREVGVDLQKEVHEDMVRARAAYPRRWGAKRDGTDTNIDHRRVRNLMVFFFRQGAALPISSSAKDYQPGDVVAWDLGGGITHIGIVVGETSPDHEQHLIVHNIGSGPQREDVLFAWNLIGHYRYFGPRGGNAR
ncbi:MAG TPA: DUF1287 domain-containing protein [Dongiaceae bacterium]|nr:DUF1287 domain-containing protein [Dongiaceae bacterium]